MFQHPFELPPPPVAGLQVGDRVRFSGDYLRSIGVHSGPLCSWCGTVCRVEGRRITVRWDHRPELPCPGLARNLARLGGAR